MVIIIVCYKMQWIHSGGSGFVVRVGSVTTKPPSPL